MVRTVAVKTRKAIVKAAQHSAEKSEQWPLTRPAQQLRRPPESVLASTASALEAGRTEIAQSTPSVKKTLGRAAKHTIGGRRRAPGGRKRTARRATTRRKTARKKAAPKRRAKRRSR